MVGHLDWSPAGSAAPATVNAATQVLQRTRVRFVLILRIANSKPRFSPAINSLNLSRTASSIGRWLKLFAPGTYVFKTDRHVGARMIGNLGKPLAHERKFGSAGMSQNRTFWDHSLILAIPFSRWGATPYVVDPIPFPSGILSGVVSESCNQDDSRLDRTHPYHQARLWLQEIENNSQITQAKIAAREGISRARVTQIMNLLDLPTEIQKDLLSPPAPLEIRSFSERRLRQLLACGDRESQLRRWQDLVRECQILVRQ